MDETSNTKPPRLWRGVLVISLALNLLVIGVVGGAALSGRIGKGPPRSFDLGLGPLARTLDQEERRAIGGALRRDRDLRRLDVRGQMTAMIEVLRQDPFDPDLLQTVMSDQNRRMVEVQQKAQAALINQIEAMPPLRRAQLADRLERELRDGRGPRNR